MDLKIVIILLRTYFRMVIFFLRILAGLYVAYVAKFLTWLVRHISIVCTLLYIILISLATASSIIFLKKI